MKQTSGWTLLGLFVSLFYSQGAVGDVLHESAEMGETGSFCGYTVSSEQFLASRFALGEAAMVTAIGGHLANENGTLFGAIVSLPTGDALPDFAAVQIADHAVASTVFSVGVPGSTDFRTPLAVQLEAGYYALVFGSGYLGASGIGFMPYNNADLPEASRFFYLATNGAWRDDQIAVTRFVVEGMRIADTDGDGLLDHEDNCIFVANPDQRDADADGIGTVCDADFDNSCTVNVSDLALMKAVFFSADPLCDMNGDGAVNFADLGMLKAEYFRDYVAFNPSGVPNVCNGG